MSVVRTRLVALTLVVVSFHVGLCLGAPAAATYDINVSIDPATRELRASSTITIDPGTATELLLARRFAVDAIEVDGQPAGVPHTQGSLSIWPLPARQLGRTIKVTWHGRLDPLDTSFDQRQALLAAAPTSGTQGTFLPAASAWYPQVRGVLQSYRITMDLPRGQRGLVPGQLLEEGERDGRYRARFEFLHPSEGIDLIAGPYEVQTRSIHTAGGAPVTLRTYFHPQIADLAAGYLDAVKNYIDLYEGWIGVYPFTEFSIVSSPTPTGFGMPTLTYLGIEVLRLPFIRATSLGHEILHNWWGNGIYPDYARGNWSEGLTTFMADYAYKERESDEAARRMRLEWLRDFAAVPRGQDRPLAEFTARTHGTSQIVGYDKAAMAFLMLRDLIGREAFDRGVKVFWRDYRFKTASWTELRASFEKASGRDLAAFFSQWLVRPGAPAVRVARAELVNSARNRVRVTIAQSAPVYRLRVPIAVRTERGLEIHDLDLDRESATFSFDVAAPAVELMLDPDLRLFRALAPEEAPPILRQVMIDSSTITVFPGLKDSVLEQARTLADALQDHPTRIGPDTIPAVDFPLLVIGLQDQIDNWLASRSLPKRPDMLKAKGSAVVWTAALPRGKSMVVVAARDAEALAALVRPLPHYGRESYLVFEGAKVTESGVWPSHPQTWRF